MKLFYLAAVLIAAAAPRPADAEIRGKDIYLDLMEEAVGAYTDTLVRQYTDEVDADGIMEHGFPRLTANIGILLAHGRIPDRKDQFERMMDICTREIPGAVQRNGDKGSIGNEFAIKEIIFCILEVKEAGLFPQEKTEAWLGRLRDMKAPDIYMQKPDPGDSEAHNWCVYGATSECARAMAGAGGDRSWADLYLGDQLRFFDENGMYRDPHSPMVYDIVTRLQYMAALDCGYDGPARPEIERNLLVSAVPTLQMQSATGEIPYGGRSNQFLHNETFYAAVCEYYASWFKKMGDERMAGRFKAAAARAVDSEWYWLDQKPIRHIKNRYPTETGYGCERYAYFDKYMVTMASWAYLAYRFADDSITASTRREPASTFVTSPDFHRIMMNAGGYTVQFDIDAQAEYDSPGIGRFQRRGAPPVVALASPCPSVPKPNYALDIANEGPLAIAPLWDSYTLVKARRGLVVLTDGKAVWRCRLGRRGLVMTLKGEGTQALTIPVLTFDGETASEIICDAGTLRFRFNGWECTYRTSGTLTDTKKEYGSRNGHLRRYETKASGRLRVCGDIRKL